MKANGKKIPTNAEITPRLNGIKDNNIKIIANSGKVAAQVIYANISRKTVTANNISDIGTVEQNTTGQINNPISKPKIPPIKPRD